MTHSQKAWPLWALLLSLGYAGWMVPRTARVFQGIGDDGELVFSSLTGALLHPPGFPLFAAINRVLVGAIDLPAYQTLSLLSVVYMSITSVFLFFICVRLSRSTVLSAMFVTIFLLFGPTQKSVTLVEVFPFHLLLSSAFIASIVWFNDTLKLRGLLVASLLLGCGGAHHPMMILWSPLLLWAIHVRVRDGQSSILTSTLRCGVFVLIGLSPYVLLFGQYSSAPLLAFGDVRDFEGLLNHALRTDYGTFQLSAHSSSEVKSYAWDFFGSVLKNSPVWFVGLFMGIRLMRRSEGVQLGSVLWCVMMLHVGFVFLLRFPEKPSFAILAERFFPCVLFAGIPVLALVLLSFSSLEKRRVLLSLVIVAPSLFMIPENAAASHRRDNGFMSAYIEECLHEIPQGGVWFTAADFDTFGAQLYHEGRKVRPDVRLLVVPRLGADWYREQLSEQFPELKGDVHVWYGESKTRQEFASKIAAGLMAKGIPVVISPDGNRLPGFEWRPLGILWQLHSPDQLPPAAETIQTVLVYCARLPDAFVLQDVDLSFHAERLEKVILPLRETRFASQGSHPGVAVAFRKSSSHIINGDLGLARSACERWLRK